MQIVYSVSSQLYGGRIFMTSEERREARYQRRKAARLARKQARCDALGPVDEIFSFRKLFYYGKNVATVSAGNSLRKTLSFIFFRGRHAAAGICCLANGDPKSAHTLFCANVARCGLLTHRTSQTGSFKKLSAKRFWFRSTPRA